MTSFQRRFPQTRRGFLTGLTAIGGLGAAYSAMRAMGLIGVAPAAAGGLSHPTAGLPAGSLASRKVVVIGAGMAGLCAGMRAARAGAEVTILEASDRIGGRSLTLRHGDSFSEWDWDRPTVMRFEPVGDMPADSPHNYLNAGPGRIPHHHSRVLDYCKELNVELEPFIFHSAANLAQNDDWNGGQPVQLRRLKNDLRGALAEMLAKANDQGALDQLIDPSEVDAFLSMLRHFGQLSQEGAELVYLGASLSDDYIRAGYEIDSLTRRQLNPAAVNEPGRPWTTLSLKEVMGSDFWQSEMFNNLEYFWQATLLQPVDGMDRIVAGFLKAPIPGNRTVRDLITLGRPVRSIDVSDRGATIVDKAGTVHQADYVIATLSPGLLARLAGNFLPDYARQVLVDLYVSPACKVGFQGRSRFWEEEDRIYGGISWTKGLATQIWYPSYGFNSATGVLTGAYNDREDAEIFQDYSREERIEVALAAGEKLHPGYRGKVFAENGVSIAWAKMPYQQGGFGFDTSFTQSALFDELKNADTANRQVFFAGDWFSYWPGWKEGALDSAHFATDRIARLALDRG